MKFACKARRWLAPDGAHVGVRVDGARRQRRHRLTAHERLEASDDVRRRFGGAVRRRRQQRRQLVRRDAARRGAGAGVVRRHGQHAQEDEEDVLAARGAPAEAVVHARALRRSRMRCSVTIKRSASG
jgi:hypothetical protein